jgi:hypothetical protein
MVVSSNYNLIPYPEHHYPIQPYTPEKALANQHPGQESIERHNRLRQPRPDIKVSAVHFDIPDNRYDSSQCLYYSDADRVGRQLDIYA